jgi:sugar phosphate isomerase/epimerase
MTRLALSTMWMQKRYASLEEFFDAGRELGFETFELSHQVNEEMVQGARIPAGDIQSVHAPCPTNPRTQGAQISSLDKEERSRAVEAAVQSIRFSEQLGVHRVVVHAGRVVVNPMLESDLRALYDQGRKGTPEYEDLQAELAEERSRYAERHLDAALRSLEEIANVADTAGVKLCLENRVHYYEIPLPDELDILLRELSGPLAFCFDTGHAYVLEQLGFVSHEEWLAGFAEHLRLAHLHDVRVVRESSEPSQHMVLGTGLQDHVVPSTGVVDFTEVLHRASEETIFTCEFDWYHSAEEVESGLTYLRDLGFQ